MTTPITPATDAIVPGYYVMDAFASTARDAIVAGPFAGVPTAEAARAHCNIADDCDVYHFDGARWTQS
jgi:hypothetical protein